ncbi:MAG TPA: HAMP domain-containing sensor histidine kinase [Actinomycetota bacterium]|nr:HAMP domain-containing sensor histidine kinase [Actinomycetota bacterium]
MSGIASLLRRRWVELLWGAFAAANVAVIVLATRWETIPFHLVWVSLSLLYGFRVWSVRSTGIVLAVVSVVTAAGLLFTVLRGHEGLDEVAEVPLMAAMFVVMVWHARRSRAALAEVRRLAESEHRLLERQRDFIRDASHELRTPITVARGYAELIAQEGAGSQAGEDARVLLDELARLERMSERLLLLATAEQPRLLSLAPVRAGAFLRDLVRRWAPTAPRRWEVAVDVEGEVLADADRLALALDALLENAVDHTGEGDRIRVAARAEGGDLVVEVSDTGPGIPPDQLGRIFERFARADQGRSRRAGGTGLGLAIARAVVEAHGGTISAESEPGAGAVFRVRLPGFRPVAGARLPGPAVSTPTRRAGAGGT